MNRILQILENCIITGVLMFGLLPIAVATAVCLAMVFHLKLAYTIFICLATLCALIWIFYYCVRHEPLLPRSWLPHFGSYCSLNTRNLFRSFCSGFMRIVKRFSFFGEALVSRPTIKGRREFDLTLIAVVSLLALAGLLLIGISVSKAVLSDPATKVRTEKNINVNKSRQKEKAPAARRNRNKRRFRRTLSPKK